MDVAKCCGLEPSSVPANSVHRANGPEEQFASGYGPPDLIR